MILGRGAAQTDTELMAEYHGFLTESSPPETVTILQRLQDAPGVMVRRIGKPISEWTDAEILALYEDRQKTTRYGYNAFWAYLLFRGYRRETVSTLSQLPFHVTREHRKALAPHRQRLMATQTALKYESSNVGTELRHLISVLAVTGKPLEELTRRDFNGFRDEYQAWYRETRRQKTGKSDARLARLERYLEHWGVLAVERRVFRHEEHFAQLCHVPIQAAIATHMQWCDSRYKPSSIDSRRASLLNFFLWLQELYPQRDRLDGVTRAVALAYAQHLRRKTDSGCYSLHYAIDLYRGIRLFYNFAIDERLATSPDRNPFTQHDLPRNANPVPRYLSDREVRILLEYCHEDDCALREQTLVITLLHTGIRAAELSALKVSDIVEIQGVWKLHIHAGKGLKDRVIPLTSQCLAMLRTWQAEGWEQANDHLFTYHGRTYSGASWVSTVIRELGQRLGIEGLTAHRFRHTFAVVLLNYGMRESALQKLMGHATLNMTLEYARILDRTVEQSFNQAVDRMQAGSLSWVPNFFESEEYTLLAAEDAINWIRLPHGYCRRNPQLHCESDVKCLLCDRFCTSQADLPRLQEMHERFLNLGMQTKADVLSSQILRLTAKNDVETEIMMAWPAPPCFSRAAALEKQPGAEVVSRVSGSAMRARASGP
jgi:site-specific recombinase XerD